MNIGKRLGSDIKLSEHRVRQIVREEIKKYNQEQLDYYNKEIKRANDTTSIRRDKVQLS